MLFFCYKLKVKWLRDSYICMRVSSGSSPHYEKWAARGQSPADPVARNKPCQTRTPPTKNSVATRRPVRVSNTADSREVGRDELD